jgi:hypothetical protein
MAITRLQQARQMFRYGGDTMGGPNDKSNDNSNDNSNNQVDTGDLGTETANVAANVSANLDARDRARMNQYTNMPTPTVTVGVDKFGQEINVPTTYTARRARQKALDALNAKGISSFDSRVTKKGINFLNPNNLVTSFAPQQKSFGILDLALMAATGGLFGTKVATGLRAYNAAKNISQLAQDFNLTDKNVLDSFTSNLTENFGKGKSKGKTSTNNTNNTNNGGDGDGIASLENQAGSYDEYILLLQKLQSGNISDSERNRFNVLKNMLGI